MTAVASGGPVSVGARSHHPVCAVGAVLLGAFLSNLHARVFSIGLGDLRGGLGLSFDEGAWLNTAATAPQILMAPAVAWLATVFGVRRLLLVPGLLYMLVSLVIPLVRGFEPLLLLHIVHGLLLGLFVPATIIVIVRNLPPRWWLPAIAVYAFRIAFAQNAGVALAGFYIDGPGWAWVYWQDLFVAPLMLVLICLGAPNERINRSLLARADWGGMLLFGSGLAMLYAGLDQGNRLDWSASGTVIGLLGGGAALLLAFLANEALVAEPWASAKVLLSRNILLMLLAATAYTITSLSNALLLPNFLIVVRQFRPEQVGPVLLAWVVLPLTMLVPVAVLLLRRIDARLVLIMGLAAFAAASLLGTGLTQEWGPEEFVAISLLQAVGQAFTFLAVMMVAFGNSNPTRATAFSAYIQVLRLGVAEIGSALMTTLLRVREQMHSNLLGQHVLAGDARAATTQALLANRFASHGAGSASARGIGTLASLVQREANVLSYIDAFRLTFWVALAGMIAVSLMTAAPPGPFTPKFGKLPWRRA